MPAITPPLHGGLPAALLVALVLLELIVLAGAHSWSKALALLGLVAVAATTLAASYAGILAVMTHDDPTAPYPLRWSMAGVPDTLMAVATVALVSLRQRAGTATPTSTDKPASAWRRLRTALTDDAVAAVEARSARAAARRSAVVQQVDAAVVQHRDAAPVQHPGTSPVQQSDAPPQQADTSASNAAVHQPVPAAMHVGAAPMTHGDRPPVRYDDVLPTYRDAAAVLHGAPHDDVPVRRDLNAPQEVGDESTAAQEHRLWVRRNTPPWAWNA